MQPNIDPIYLESQGLSITFPQRFIKKVEITDNHWIWNGSTRPCSNKWPKGHGMIQRREGVNCKIYAHRAAWILFVGPIPDGMMVLHCCPGGTCPFCVNPDHLKLGDGFENMRDMTAEGDNYFSKHSFKGEKSAKAKLNWEKVREIRRLHASGNHTLKSLGIIYGVHLGCIHSVVKHKTWIEEVAADFTTATIITQ